jgi:hypothetical protein
MRLLATFFCALVLGASAPAWADVTRDQAAQVAQRASGGRVLAVERAETREGAVWRVKVLTAAGEVRVVLVDVASGRTL